MDVWEEIWALAEDQHGAFTAVQADEVGADSGWRGRAQRDRRIGRLRRGAFAVIALLDDWTPMAATQLLVPRSVAARRAAGLLNGFDGIDVLAMDVLVPPNTNLSGRFVYRCNDLVVPEIVVIDGLRCTDAVRTLCDLGAVVERANLERAVESFLRRDQTKEALIRDRAEALARRGRSGPRQLLAVLDGRPSIATDSDLETVYWQCLVEHGVDLPARQHEVRVDGRHVATLDFAWPPEKVFAELDGWATHGSRSAFGRDRRRQNAVVELGWVPVRFTDSDVREFGRRTASVTQGVLDRRRSELLVVERV